MNSTERHKRTVTLHAEEKDPAVIGLKALGDRKPIRFSDFRTAMIRVGRAPDCHIRVSDRHVSTLQCFLVRKGRAWLLAPYGRAKNASFVNSVEATGDTPLFVGSFVRLGNSIWLCVDENDREGEWRLAASNQQEFLQTALLAYGAGHAGGKGVGIHPNTFRRRLRADPCGSEIAEIIEAIRKREQEFKCARAEAGRDRAGYCSPVGYPIAGAVIRPGVVVEPLKLYSEYNEDGVVRAAIID